METTGEGLQGRNASLQSPSSFFLCDCKSRLKFASFADSDVVFTCCSLNH